MLAATHYTPTTMSIQNQSPPVLSDLTYPLLAHLQAHTSHLYAVKSPSSVTSDQCLSTCPCPWTSTSDQLSPTAVTTQTLTVHSALSTSTLLALTPAKPPPSYSEASCWSLLIVRSPVYSQPLQYPVRPFPDACWTWPHITPSFFWLLEGCMRFSLDHCTDLHTTHASNTPNGSQAAQPVPTSQSREGEALFDDFAWTVECLPTLEKSYVESRLCPVAKEMGAPGGYLDCLF
jgi:hypothetical protein